LKLLESSSILKPSRYKKKYYLVKELEVSEVRMRVKKIARAKVHLPPVPLPVNHGHLQIIIKNLNKRPRGSSYSKVRKKLQKNSHKRVKVKRRRIVLNKLSKELKRIFLISKN
jgi:hypothetical protein